MRSRREFGAQEVWPRRLFDIRPPNVLKSRIVTSDSHCDAPRSQVAVRNARFRVPEIA